MNTTLNIRRNFYTVFALLAVLIFSFASCEKHVTPNKIERKISNDSWRIVEFMYDHQDITLNYADDEFAFGEAGQITLLNNDSINGYWSTGLDKPTLFYLESFFTEKYEIMNDDYQVVHLTDDLFKLRADYGQTVNRITFSKIQ